MKKYEIKISELKKEITETEADALACNLLFNIAYLHITHGATIMEKYKAQKVGTPEAAGDLFGLPYISNSVNNEAAALWNTNTSAELVGGGCFKFLGVAVGNGGEFVGLFQEHNESGEEVGAVRCLILDNLADFIADRAQKIHEAERREKLAALNQYHATIREQLPKACAVLEKYRGKRWGAATLDKIRAELKELNRDGVSVWASVGSYWVDLEFTKGSAWGNSWSVSFKWDTENNTPAEEITPPAQAWDKLQPIQIKEHRAMLAGYIKEIEKTAEHLTQLIKLYQGETRGKGYGYFAENISPYGVDLSRLNAAYLDE